MSLLTGILFWIEETPGTPVLNPSASCRSNSSVRQRLGEQSYNLLGQISSEYETWFSLLVHYHHSPCRESCENKEPGESVIKDKASTCLDLTSFIVLTTSNSAEVWKS